MQSLAVPRLPSAAEFKRAEDAVRGGAEKLFQSYIESVTRYEGSVRLQIDEVHRDQIRLRRSHIIAIVCGFMLGMASLAVCTYGIYRESNLLQLAAVIGPTAGLAGVFLWGYTATKAAPLPQIPPTALATPSLATISAPIKQRRVSG